MKNGNRMHTQRFRGELMGKADGERIRKHDESVTKGEKMYGIDR